MPVGPMREIESPKRFAAIGLGVGYVSRTDCWGICSCGASPLRKSQLWLPDHRNMRARYVSLLRKSAKDSAPLPFYRIETTYSRNLDV